ncbi:unnamed protein product [Amoebophrya sp. A25]|nr:unnamed protein product [Amoebophrya sp. A25]|eukprot:GSA25T00002095001.1
MFARPTATTSALYLQPLGSVEFCGMKKARRSSSGSASTRGSAREGKDKTSDSEDAFAAKKCPTETCESKADVKQQIAESVGSSQVALQVKTLPRSLQQEFECDPRDEKFFLSQMRHLTNQDSEFLRLLEGFLSAFFPGMRIRILPYRTLDIESPVRPVGTKATSAEGVNISASRGASTRRKRDTSDPSTTKEKSSGVTSIVQSRFEHLGQHQLHGGDIIHKALPKWRLPLRDAYAFLGMTFEDLYPRDEWNFCFGVAEMLGRNGVFSFNRYTSRRMESDEASSSDICALDRSRKDAEGEEQAAIGKPASPTSEAASLGAKKAIVSRARLLKRAAKVMAHELCHCFGMKHCIFFNCLMQGSNSGPEAERKPHFLCPVCLTKLFYSLEFSAVDRYRRLQQWVDTVIETQPSTLDKEMYQFVFGNWSKWYARRIESTAQALGGSSSSNEQ